MPSYITPLPSRLSSIERKVIHDLVFLIEKLQLQKSYRYGKMPHATVVNVIITMLRAAIGLVANANNAEDIKKADSVVDSQNEIICACCKAGIIDILCRCKNGLSGAEGGYKLDHP